MLSPDNVSRALFSHGDIKLADNVLQPLFNVSPGDLSLFISNLSDAMLKSKEPQRPVLEALQSLARSVLYIRTLRS